VPAVFIPAVNTRPSVEIHTVCRRQYSSCRNIRLSHVLDPTTKRREYMLVTFIECLIVRFFHISIYPFETQRLLVVLLLSLDRRHGDAVQVTLASLCDPAASLLLVLLEDSDLLKCLHDLAVDGAGSVDVV